MMIFSIPNISLNSKQLAQFPASRSIPNSSLISYIMQNFESINFLLREWTRTPQTLMGLLATAFEWHFIAFKQPIKKRQ